MAAPPIPRADDAGPPAGVTPTVALDIEADIAGEPRPKAESPPPPGTVRPSFWQAGATKGAIVVTVGLALMYLRSLILDTPISRDALALAVEAVVWAWAGAIGLSKTDADALVWK